MDATSRSRSHGPALLHRYQILIRLNATNLTQPQNPWPCHTFWPTLPDCFCKIDLSPREEWSRILSMEAALDWNLRLLRPV